MIGLVFDADVIDGVGLAMIGAGVDLHALAGFLAWWMPLNLVLHTALIVLGAAKYRLDTREIPLHHYLTHTLIFLPRVALALIELHAERLGRWTAAYLHKRKTA